METKEIYDKQVWEDYVLDLRHNTSFFHSWNWGDFEKSLGKTVNRVGFYKNNQLVAVAQLVEVKAKRGKFLHIRNGPFMYWKETKLVESVTTELKNIAKLRNCDFIRLSPQIEYSDKNEKLLKNNGFIKNQMHDVDAEITWVLDLTQDLDTILQKMRKNTRYYIRKAEKEGVKIIVSTKTSDLEEFYKIYIDTVERQKWNAYNFEYLKKEFEIFKKDDQIKIYLAEYQGKVIASSLFIYYRGEVFYHHSGSLTKFRHIPASYLIQWQSIKNAKETGNTKYNFFGIARDDISKHPWAGLSFFKKGFGGFEQRWVHGHDLPLKYKYWVTFLYEYFERVSRGY
mgnify:CR=1 FL=1